jgi:glutamate-5-semialdehyde dehydrogenase
MNALQQIELAKEAAISLIEIETTTEILLDLAERTERSTRLLIEANLKDLENMPEDDPKYDRLMLTEDRIISIAADLRSVAGLASPVGEVIEQRQLSNGLKLRKMRVPLGVVGVIYEARPNVTFDVFALCLRSGNVSVLKGGSDAMHSNQAIVKLIHQSLEKCKISTDIVQLLPPDRESASTLMNAVGMVDVLIPRGSQKLINFVRDHAKVPVIETGAGVVHTYFDKSGDLDLGKKIVFNAKTRRVSVCNALDCLIVHSERLPELSELVAQMADKSVIIEADSSSYAVLESQYPAELLFRANEKSFGREFLDYRMAVKTVRSIEEALKHINQFSTGHSEAIITTDSEAEKIFCDFVDAAAVYVNTSTAFTDGAQFGMGAEIGISTQKLHARGPMALPELTSYKWIIASNGLTRP